MTHKLIPQSLNLVAGLMLISGISLAAMQAPTYANLSGGGASVGINLQSNDVELRPAATVTYINPYQQADAGIQLILGMLLIMLGFFIHGFARASSERPVHITIAPPKPKHEHKWFWMEMRI